MPSTMNFTYHTANDIVLMDIAVDEKYIVTAKHVGPGFVLPAHNSDYYGILINYCLNAGNGVYKRDPTIAKKIKVNGSIVMVKTNVLGFVG